MMYAADFVLPRWLWWCSLFVGHCNCPLRGGWGSVCCFIVVFERSCLVMWSPSWTRGSWSHFFSLFAHRNLFTLYLNCRTRLCSVIVRFPGYLLYHFTCLNIDPIVILSAEIAPQWIACQIQWSLDLKLAQVGRCLVGHLRSGHS